MNQAQQIIKYKTVWENFVPSQRNISRIKSTL